jgi:ABC-type sugar transport system permease subunit
MGFTVMNKRISYSLVVTLLIKAATYTPIVFSLMLSFTKVENEEQTLAQEEQAIETEEESLLGNMTHTFTCAACVCPVC